MLSRPPRGPTGSGIYCDNPLQMTHSKSDFAQNKWIRREPAHLKGPRRPTALFFFCFFLKPSTLCKRLANNTSAGQSGKETYRVLVGHGTCWRNAVQTAEMRRVTLQVGRQQGSAFRHTCTSGKVEKKKKKKSWGYEGNLGRKLAVNHILSRRHAITFSHAASQTHSVLSARKKEWRLCFKERLTHPVRTGVGTAACYRLCTGGPESTLKRGKLTGGH